MKDRLREQKMYFQTGATLSLDLRRQQLHKLLWLIQKYEPEILSSLKADLRKSPFEAYTSELAMVVQEIQLTLKMLKKWAAPRSVPMPLFSQPASAKVWPEPLGQVLIISPWNYPWNLCLTPLVGALAAGNVAVVKPSEFAPHSSRLLAQLVADNFPAEYLTVIEGDHRIGEELLDHHFDHIFFTGSTKVGRTVMEKASRHLTPVTLELGGKSPCIVDSSADLEVAARRIAWGKFYNAGQTCVAPDFLLVDQRVKETLVQKLKAAIESFYGKDPSLSPDFGRIVHPRHHQRLQGLLTAARIRHGGTSDEKQLYVSPTLLDEVSWDSALMQEEIFGPLLPILTYSHQAEIFEHLQSLPKPLALYVFTQDSQLAQSLQTRVAFGSGCLNDCLLQLSNPHLPFGGVGGSGMGRYRGHFSFQTFSNQKAWVKKSAWIDFSLRYPPYSLDKWRWIRRFLG